MNENLLHDLLESLDNFDRATDAASSAKDVKSIADGVKMINASLVKMLEDKYNLSSYGAPGDTFDPDEHEAIGSVEGAVAEPVLKEVYLKGYKLLLLYSQLARADVQLRRLRKYRGLLLRYPAGLAFGRAQPREVRHLHPVARPAACGARLGACHDHPSGLALPQSHL